MLSTRTRYSPHRGCGRGTPHTTEVLSTQRVWTKFFPHSRLPGKNLVVVRPPCLMFFRFLLIENLPPSHSGLRRENAARSKRLSVSLFVEILPCPYGMPCRRVHGLSTGGFFKESLFGQSVVWPSPKPHTQSPHEAPVWPYRIACRSVGLERVLL